MKRSRISAASKTSLMIVLSILISGAASHRAEFDLVRQGNEAFAKGDFQTALNLYRQAEETIADPGLVAFNKATAFYHLGQFRDAEQHYRLALEDGEIPKDRRLRALYNLGNSLLRQAGEQDEQRLRDAIRCYELCLDGRPDEPLRRDAAKNEELAKVLWNKARAGKTKRPPPNADSPPESQPPEPKKQHAAKKGDDTESGTQNKNGKNVKDKKIDKEPDDSEKSKDDPRETGPAPKPAPSRVPVIPDTDQLEPRSAEDTRLSLQAAESRLKKERQRNRQDLAIPEIPSGRDW